MAISTRRRYYLLRWKYHQSAGNGGLAEGWRGKHLAEPSTPLAADFPGKATLESAGYSAVEDVAGATTDELLALGLSSAQATAALAALP